MAVLRVRKGASTGSVYAVHDCMQPTLLGRDKSASITLDDNRASRKHSRILRAHGAWIIQDLGSRNGTHVGGKPVERARIGEGTLIQIGNTLLSFHPEEYAPPPSDEVYGTRLLSTDREEGGVTVYRAFQAAMDREVRIDRTARDRRLPSQVQDAITTAAQEAQMIDHPGVDALVHAQVTGEKPHYVVLRRRTGESLADCLESILKESLGRRLELFRQLTAAMLSRGAKPALCAPVGLHQVTVSRGGGGQLAISVPVIEFGAVSTARTGGLRHLPTYAHFLAPELQEAQGGPPAVEYPAAVYGVGAIGYQLLSGEPPMGKVSHRKILENHRSIEPAPANLISPDIPEAASELIREMLAKDPAERPSDLEEMLAVIDRALSQVPALEAVPAARQAEPAPSVRPDPCVSRDRTAEAPRPRRRIPPPKPTPQGAGSGARGDEAGRRAAPYSRKAPFFYSLHALPLWCGVWLLLFFGVRYLSRYFFTNLE